MNIVEIRIAGRYKLGAHIGTGGYSEVYQGRNVHSGEDVAIKLEDQKNRYPQVIYEGQLIQQLQGGKGIPGVYWCGHDGDYNILVMELLGDNLAKLLKTCGNKLSYKTTLMLADQALQIMEHIHTKGIIHRDINPENFLMGYDANYHLLHLIDFGLAKRFIDPKTGEHIPSKTGKSLLGKPQFASQNSHKGNEMSRRDDQESLSYMLLYLLKGCLPWTIDNENNTNMSKYDIVNKLYDTKNSFNFSPDKAPSDVPKEFFNLVELARGLKFDEQPPYLKIRRMFKELFVRSYYEFDYVYDWFLIPMKTILKEKIMRLDEVLDEDDDIQLKNEEELLAKIMKDYEQNPEILEFDLSQIKEQQKKFQQISNDDTINDRAIVPSNKKKEDDNKRVNKTGGKKTNKKATKKNQENCNLF